MKTDPQNSDYTVESGAARNFEPWRAEDEVGEEEQRKRDAEEMGDAMKSLENRTNESKREMDILAALDELKSMKSRHAHVSVDKMLEALQRSAPVQQQEDNLEEEDEALIESFFQGSREFIRRIDDDELDDDDEMILAGPDNGKSSKNGSKKQKVFHGVSDSPTDYLAKSSTIEKLINKKDVPSGTFALKSSTIKFSVVKKQSEAKTQANEKEEKAETTSGNGLQSLCQQYEDSNEERVIKFRVCYQNDL
nr:splicing factor YJU2-like isoform X2 [Erigeron canadensis]